MLTRAILNTRWPDPVFSIPRSLDEDDRSLSAVAHHGLQLKFELLDRLWSPCGSSISAIHQLRSRGVISRMNHFVHHPAARASVVNGPRICMDIAQFAFEPVCHQHRALTPLEISKIGPIRATPPERKLIEILRRSSYRTVEPSRRKEVEQFNFRTLFFEARELCDSAPMAFKRALIQ